MYRKKNLIIISMCVMILFMVVGYAVFSTNLKINGTGTVASTWDIYFESITTTSTTTGAKNKVSPSVSGLNATMNYELDVPGDKIVYEIVLKNNGTLNAVVESISANKGGATQINYTISGIKKGDKISSKTTKTITITIEYDPNTTQDPAFKETFLTIKLTCVQDAGNISSENLVVYQPTLKQETSSTGETVAFLYGPITKESIESVTFTNTKTVPTGVKGSWDVSAASDSSVMAWYFDADGDNLNEVYIGQDGGVIANVNSGRLFSYMINLTSIDFTYFDTSKAINMYNLFYECLSLENLDLSNFDTSSAVSMAYMFYNCQKLTSLHLGNFDTSDVTYMSFMFANCRSLTDLDILNFDTSNVTNMSGMFFGCFALTELDLNSFVISPQLTNMSKMFKDCRNLKKLDIRTFKTPGLTDVGEMFRNCFVLEEVDMRGFTFDNVTESSDMFTTTPASPKIRVGSVAASEFILSQLSTANVVIG